MTVPVLETFTAQDVGNVTTIDCTEPTGFAVGDILIIIAIDGKDQSTSPFDGTSMSDDSFDFEFAIGHADTNSWMGVFTRVADGLEDDPVTVTMLTSSRYYASAWYVRVSGGSATLDGNSSEIQNTSPSSSTVLTGYTTVADDVLAFYMNYLDNGDGLPMSVSGTGWSETDEHQRSTQSNQSSGSFGTKDMGVAGATGTATVTTNVSDTGGGIQFGIAPSASTALLLRRRR